MAADSDTAMSLIMPLLESRTLLSEIPPWSNLVICWYYSGLQKQKVQTGGFVTVATKVDSNPVVCCYLIVLNFF